MQRPTSITVFGVLNIVFGGMGLCAPFALLPMYMEGEDTQNPVYRVMFDSTPLMVWTVVGAVLGFVVAIALIAAGIALLVSDRAWGRTLSLIYGWYAIPVTVIGSLMNLFFLAIPLFRQLEEFGDDPEVIGGAIGGAVGSLGGCLGVIYPILLLVFMYREPVRRHFAGPATAPA